jgi:hypothetical protein
MAPRDLRYRFQWNSPIVISPHGPDILYHASQFIHRTTNEGQTWEVISPDLTRNDPEKQDFAGGPITHDMTGVEVYDTVFALAESPHERGVIWAGSNDGLVHLTRDNGKTWKNVTPPELPEWSTVNRIEISPHEPGKVYLAVYRYRMDDFRPYIYRTRDYGQSWELLTDGENGIPANHPARAVREDPDREGLLYAGTEYGLFVSFDDGAHWQSLQLNLPHTPVTDLVLHQKDLVVATQGRSFWILDDVTPLHQLSDQVASSQLHLFEPRNAFRTPGQPASPDDAFARDPIYGARMPMDRVGQNPPAGALIYYFLGDGLDVLTLEILDADGGLVRRFSSADNGEGGPTLSTNAGLNRFVWDLAYPGPELAAEPPMARYLSRGGPTAVPGTYQVRLTSGDWGQVQSFQVEKDPRLDTTLADFEAQFEILIRIRDRVNEMHAALRQVQATREQLLEMGERQDVDEELRNEIQRIQEELAAIESEFIQTGTISPFALPPKLTGKFAWVYTLVSSADARPTDASEERVRDLEQELGEHLNRLKGILDVDVRNLNALLSAKGAPAILPRR